MVDDRQTHSLPQSQEALDNVARLHGLADGERAARSAAAACRAGAARSTTRSAARAARRGCRRSRRRSTPSSPPPASPTPAPARARIEGWRSGRMRSLRTAGGAGGVRGDAAGADRGARRRARSDAARSTASTTSSPACRPGSISTGCSRRGRASPSSSPRSSATRRRWPRCSGGGRELLDGLIDASAFDPVGPVEALAARFARADRARRGLSDAARSGAAAGQRDPLRARRPDRRSPAPTRSRSARAMAGSPRRRSRCSPTPPSPSSRRRMAGCRDRGWSSSASAGSAAACSPMPRTSISSICSAAATRPNRTAPKTAARHRLFQPARAARRRRAQRADRRRPALRRRHQAAAVGHGRAARHLARHLRRLSAREGLDLRAYGADPGAARSMARTRTARRSAGIVDAMLRIDARPGAASPPTRRGCGSRSPATSAPSGPFDIKLGPGGLVDLEFAIHTLQLTHRIGLAPRVSTARSRRLPRPAWCRRRPPSAHRLLTRMLVTLRLVSPDSAEPPPASRDLSRGPAGQRGGRNCLRPTTMRGKRSASLWERGDKAV